MLLKAPVLVIACSTASAVTESGASKMEYPSWEPICQYRHSSDPPTDSSVRCTTVVWSPSRLLIMRAQEPLEYVKIIIYFGTIFPFCGSGRWSRRTAFHAATAVVKLPVDLAKRPAASLRGYRSMTG